MTNNDNNDKAKIKPISPALALFCCAPDGSMIEATTVKKLLDEMRDMLSLAGFSVGAYSIGTLEHVREKMIEMSNNTETPEKLEEAIATQEARKAEAPRDVQLLLPNMDKANEIGDQKVRDSVIPVSAVLKGIKF